MIRETAFFSERCREMDPKNTVHLPKTAFPMRAALSEREPAQVKAWEEQKIYEQLLAKNAQSEKFVFHDGPPYANGRSEEHTSELQSHVNLVCRLLLEKKKY